MCIESVAGGCVVVMVSNIVGLYVPHLIKLLDNNSTANRY